MSGCDKFLSADLRKITLLGKKLKFMWESEDRGTEATDSLSFGQLGVK
jgi:hypothetical protein